MDTTEYAIGDLLRRFPQLTRQRLVYLLETRRIQPVRRFGVARIYDADAVMQLERAIQELETRRNAIAFA
jgi:hypothetical protein